MAWKTTRTRTRTSTSSAPPPSTLRSRTASSPTPRRSCFASGWGRRVLRPVVHLGGGSGVPLVLLGGRHPRLVGCQRGHDRQQGHPRRQPDATSWRGRRDPDAHVEHPGQVCLAVNDQGAACQGAGAGAVALTRQGGFVIPPAASSARRRWPPLVAGSRGATSGLMCKLRRVPTAVGLAVPNRHPCRGDQQSLPVSLAAFLCPASPSR